MDYELEEDLTETEVFIIEAEHEIKLMTRECEYCYRTGVKFVPGDHSWYCEVHL